MHHSQLGILVRAAQRAVGIDPLAGLTCSSVEAAAVGIVKDSVSL